MSDADVNGNQPVNIKPDKDKGEMPVVPVGEPNADVIRAQAELILAQAKLKEAEAKERDSETKADKAHTSLIDRIIMRGLIPIALLVATPLATYYFTDRAEEGIRQVQATNQEVEAAVAELDQLGVLVGRLDKLFKGADERIQQMDQARAAELTALRVLVTRLHDALKVMAVQTAVSEAARSHYQEARVFTGDSGMRSGPTKAALLTSLRERREKIVQQAQQQIQAQWPGDDDEVREKTEAAFDRYLERQEQVQHQDE